MARQQGVDLVEIAAAATPPVCRLVDFGKFRYEQAKREKESKKHQHSNKVKEIQLSPSIDPHDFGVKLAHTIDFLCDEMKVKVTLRFRGREMAHKEYGFQQVQRLITEVAPYGHPDQPPKLIGKGITAMLSPLPRTKRAKNPHRAESAPESAAADGSPRSEMKGGGASPNASRPSGGSGSKGTSLPASESEAGFNNNPFSNLEIPPADESNESAG